eukprot:3088330-Alexandrium_andersonii.AAC.1
MVGYPDSLSAMLLAYQGMVTGACGPRPGGGKPRTEGGARISPRPGKANSLPPRGGWGRSA